MRLCLGQNAFDSATGEYNGLWKHNNNPISGVNWRNFGSKKKDNEEALSVNPIEFNWFDIALLLFPGPVLGELWGGLINRNIDNQKY